MEILYQSSSSIRLTIGVDGSPRNADIVNDVHQVFITITKVSDDSVIVNNQGAENEDVGIYKYLLDPNDNGTLDKFKVTWTYTVDGEPFTKTQFYDVVVPYTSASEFRSEFSEFSSKTDAEIYHKEKLARHIINTFCHQSFDFELDVTKKVEGNDSQKLLLPKRIYTLSEVLISNEEDITDTLEIYTDHHLRRTDIDDEFDERRNLFGLDYFRKHTYYFVTGDWGWEYVPDDISKATNLLIADYFGDDSLLRQHGVFQATIGDEQYYFNNDLWNTTGNYDVDMLISNYTDINMTLF